MRSTSPRRPVSLHQFSLLNAIGHRDHRGHSSSARLRAGGASEPRNWSGRMVNLVRQLGARSGRSAMALRTGRLLWVLLGLSTLAVRDDFLRAPTNGLGNGLAVLYFEGSEAGDRLRGEIERFKLGEGFPEGLTPGESVLDVGHLSFADFPRRSAYNTNVNQLTLAPFYCCNRFPSVINAGYLITLSANDTFAEKNLKIGVSSSICPV